MPAEVAVHAAARVRLGHRRLEAVGADRAERAAPVDRLDPLARGPADEAWVEVVLERHAADAARGEGTLVFLGEAHPEDRAAVRGIEVLHLAGIGRGHRSHGPGGEHEDERACGAQSSWHLILPGDADTASEASGGAHLLSI